VIGDGWLLIGDGWLLIGDGWLLIGDGWLLIGDGWLLIGQYYDKQHPGRQANEGCREVGYKQLWFHLRCSNRIGPSGSYLD
jgi:hypothetical protein